MAVDVVVLGLTAVFALLGFFSGFVAQAVRLVALVGAYLLAGATGAVISGPLCGSLEVSGLVCRAGAMGLGFIAAYLLLTLTGWAVVKLLRKLMGKPRGGSLDRWGGMVIGGLKVFALCYLVLCAAVLAEKPLAKKLGKNPLKDSVLARLARRYNPLAGLHMPVVGKAGGLVRLAGNPQLAAKLKDDPAVRKLLGHPKIKALGTDRALQRAAERGDIGSMLSNPRLNEVFSDPEIQRLLWKIDLGKLDER